MGRDWRKIENDENNFNYHVLKRTDKGVYRITLKGDYLNKKYGTWAEGTYKIVCQDPFKYSTTVYESSPVVSGHEATFTINLQNNSDFAVLYRTLIKVEEDNGLFEGLTYEL